MTFADNIHFSNLIIKKEGFLIEEFLRKKSFCFESFKNFSIIHQLEGYFYLQIKEGGIEHCFPKDLMKRYESMYLKQWMQNEKLLKEMEGLSNIFNEAKKEAIFLKGPFFAQRIYGNIDRRKIRDIDILIKKDDIEDAKELLSRCGYKLTSGIFLNRFLTLKFTHHLEYWKKDIPLDMHWVLDSHCSYNLDYRDIWNTKVSYISKNKEYCILSDEYQLVFRILGIFKDIQLSNLTLRSCLDAYMLLKHIDINWEDFFSKRKEENIFKVSINILDLVLSLFNCREEFGILNNFVMRHIKEVKYFSTEDKLKLFYRKRIPWMQKKWAFSLYEINIIMSLFWEAISLPFRMAIHKEHKNCRLT